jgi:hypothetical protein
MPLRSADTLKGISGLSEVLYTHRHDADICCNAMQRVRKQTGRCRLICTEVWRALWPNSGLAENKKSSGDVRKRGEKQPIGRKRVSLSRHGF